VLQQDRERESTPVSVRTQEMLCKTKSKQKNAFKNQVFKSQIFIQLIMHSAQV
jgi:hypothetical protein